MQIAKEQNLSVLAVAKQAPPKGRILPLMSGWIGRLLKCVGAIILWMGGGVIYIAWAGEGNFPLHWSDRTYSYWYNPAHEPAWLADGVMLPMIQRAAAGWNACGVRLLYSGITDKSPGDMDGVNVIGWRQDGSKHSAWTQWRARRSTGDAIEADVILYTNIYDDYRRRGIDAELELYKSIAHEFGHVLGLGHSDVASDVMSVRVRTRPEWQLPSGRDIARCQANLIRP